MSAIKSQWFSRLGIKSLVVISILLLTACALKSDDTYLYSASVTGTWIIDKTNKTMLDPQTSGLVYKNGDLFSVSDGSAHVSQIKRLHKINPKTAKVSDKYGPFVLSTKVQKSCFAGYLNERPDYEAIVNIPQQDNAWLLVTEDATRAGDISEECQQKFANTGSTVFPTLLVKIERVNDNVVVSGVRALQFDPSFNLGNFPNDGIEGLAITRDGRLLLGLEKDQNTQARVFELQYQADMFDELDSFVSVKDSHLLFPKFSEGNHPINGMDVYYPNKKSRGYLIAAARNDHQIWILDLAKKKQTVVIDMAFFAPSESESNCDKAHRMKSASLEGVAVKDDYLYMINDPWKRVYKDNIVCEQDASKYNEFAPLLFKMKLQKEWFK